MPYYRWHGVDIVGDMHKGLLFARDQTHLDVLLLIRNIALLSCRIQRQWIKKPIRMKDKLQFFRQLSVLIDAGILLPDALGVVADQLSHPPFQELMYTVSIKVKEGSSFHNALAEYPMIFDYITIQLCKAGEESGRMDDALGAIIKHMAATHDFYIKVRAALLVPAITILFFFVVMILLCTLVLPRFIALFSFTKQEMPGVTKILLVIAEGIQTPLMGVFVVGMGLLILIGWRYTRVGRGRRMLDRFYGIIPVFSSLIQQRCMGYTMHALSVLLQGGMPLFESLGVVRVSMQNELFKERLQALEDHIAAGHSLSEALLYEQGYLGTSEVVAMIEVGQRSGRLSLMLSRLADIYYERVTLRLTQIALLLQPSILLILGLLVAFLIFAVYSPIFTVSGGF